jgi:radical SAM protein with 4Fe4S-binding SPASM domain
MTSLSKLLCAEPHTGDRLRYHAGASQARRGTGQGSGPVVVWNWTRSCNLRCAHCYSDAAPQRFTGEMDGAEARALIDDCRAFRVPALILSGGEPLMRPDAFELLAYAAERGLRCTLSTNGTLINAVVARRLHRMGVAYVGISLDGPPAVHNTWRGRSGAFERSLAAVRHLKAAGQRVGLRFTLQRGNLVHVPFILNLVEEEGVDRVCFYHLVPTGRGRDVMDVMPTPAQTRAALDTILARTVAWHEAGRDIEVLTVDNHADGPYAYLWAQRHLARRAPEVLALLRRNGGNRSGSALACVDSRGEVFPDQFSRRHSVGNVRREKFHRIWSLSDDPLLAALRDRRGRLSGRCTACSWLPICNGNLRARAEGLAGDFWASDPGCYLTDEEIGPGAEGAGTPA